MFCLFISGNFLYAQKIKIKTENGVTVVYNPKNPAPPPGTPTKLILKEDLIIGEKEGSEEYMFSRIESLDVDDEGSELLCSAIIYIRNGGVLENELMLQL